MYKIKKVTYFDSIYIETKDIKVEFIDYGATIKQIQTKNCQNMFEDILLEYNSNEDYINNSIYLNATIGPIAGRIKNGIIETKNNSYLLDKNQENKHTLHSSNLSLSFKKFDYKIIEKNNETQVIFTYTDSSFSDLNYTVTVTYTVIGMDIRIHYNVKTKNDFYFNLTNHAYFNLSGNLTSNIENHVVSINTNKHHELDQDLVSTNHILQDKLFNFTTPKSLEKPLSILETKPNKGFDDIYFFENTDNTKPKASLYDPVSKRVLDIYSTYDHMVFYTHNNINEKILKHINDHYYHYAVCFEFQKSPHKFTLDSASNTYLKHNQEYNEDIVFKFSIRD